VDGPESGKYCLLCQNVFCSARAVPSEALWQLDRLELLDIAAQLQYGVERFRRHTVCGSISVCYSMAILNGLGRKRL
jgi:hypothetical protein